VTHSNCWNLNCIKSSIGVALDIPNRKSLIASGCLCNNMPGLDQTETDALTARILQKLAQTRYACLSLTLLSGGSANFIFRGLLATPLSEERSYTKTTVFVKHYADFLACSRDFKIDVSRCVRIMPHCVSPFWILIAVSCLKRICSQRLTVQQRTY